MKKTLIALAIAAVSASPAFAGKMKTYTISITNATNNQVVTPPLLVTHNRKFNLFEIGQPASDGLAILAETGDNQVALSEAEGASGVFDTVAGAAPIPPGTTATFTIRAPIYAKLSMAGMLATTNDAFAGLSGISLPYYSSSYLAYVYDAGSEENNELCDYIPGPPCGGASNLRATDNAEGFVAIHRGVHGIGDISAADLDWRGPAVLVSIKRGSN